MIRPTRRTRHVNFTVEGGGTFPFDMLRYDACYPASERESPGLDWQGQPGLRQVTLVHRVLKDENLSNYPSPRWPSFGWHVVPGSVNYEE